MAHKDKNEPPDKAAERLKQFEEARGAKGEESLPHPPDGADSGEKEQPEKKAGEGEGKDQ